MSDQVLAGKTALVTGASRGIGRAIALSFAQAGADVALVARDAEKLGEIADEISDLGRSAQVITADLSSEDAVESICSSLDFDVLNILVNNAGGNSFMATTEKMRLSGWRKTMNLNLDALVAITQGLITRLVN